MRIATIYDNHGQKTEVIAGLKAGDKLLCIQTERSTSGIGLWSTTRYDSFEKGKTYEVHHLYNWDGVMVAYVMDEDATLTWARPETFSLLPQA